MKAMILTAGFEERLQPKPSESPKAFIRINNEPLLGMLIRRLADSGYKEIILNVHHFARLIKDYLEKNNNFGIRIEVSDE